MKYADLFHLKSVQVALLIFALTGTFLLGRCSAPEPTEEKEPAVEKKTELVQTEPGSPVDGPVSTTATAEQEEIQFDEQCRDIRLDAQCCILSFLHPAGEGTIICMAPELKLKESLPPPVILLKPSGKNKRIAPPEQKKALSLSVVLLKPSGKKRLIAPPEKLVKKYSADILGENDKSTCEGGLIPALQATVAFLESRYILYGIGPLSDCSGIFHQVLLGVKRRCRNHAYPSPQHYRDSRDLARWYHEQGELILIRNALERPDLIRPGMVFFFGRSGAVYRNFTVKELLTRQRGIRHVGVVTRVHKDKAGRVVGYELFHGHGQRGKTAASITRWHKRTPAKAGYPPFGNGREQLVAAARLVRP